MTYAQQKDFRDRATAIAGVAAIHAAIGIGLVVGMTVVGAAPAIDEWDPFTLTPERKKTPPPPQPQPSQKAANTTVIVAPVPPIRTQRNEDTNVVVDTGTPNKSDTFTDWNVVLPTPTPSPRPSFAPRGASPSNNRNSWISNDDYPASPLRNGVQGNVGYSLVVGTNGRVSACDVTRTSGNQQLDDATCRLIVRRARFEAATDESGAKVVGTFSGTVRWEIPD